MPSDEETSDEDVAAVEGAVAQASESEDGFVYFRMAGGRFDAGRGMPAAAASELQRYSELVYEVARLEWLKEHPERRNVRGLSEAFDLRLVRIEDGSARPVFRLETRFDVRQTLGDPAPLFVRARDVVNETISEIAVNHELPTAFPREAVEHLKRLGRTLADGESIALAQPRSPGDAAEPRTTAILTTRVKDVIATIDQALVEEPEWFDAVGVVTEFDGAKGTFRLDMPEGGSLVCRLGSQEREVAEIVKAVLAADGVTAPDVSVGGIAEFGRDRTVRALWDVSEVHIVRSATEKAIMARFEELAELERGWWGPDSRAPGAIALANARELIEPLGRSEQRVAIGADGDGSIVIEWRRGVLACTAEIQADGDMYLFVIGSDRRIHEEYEGPFDVDGLMTFVEGATLHG